MRRRFPVVITRAGKSEQRGSSSNSPRLYVARLPALVEERLERTVEAQQREPAFAGHGSNPIPLLARRARRPEINVDRSVVVRRRLGVGADAREWLAVAQQRSAFGVIDDDRPETLDRNISRQAQPI